MIIYREQRRQVRTADVLQDLASRAPSSHASLRDLLIEFGELECGVADSLPSRHPAIAELRRISVDLGRCLYRSQCGSPFSPPSLEVRSNLPACIEMRVSEGYAYYGLFPETYMEAAKTFFRERFPRKCVVIGIRSIGTSLSAAVAGTLAELGVSIDSFTIRPTGHPFDRSVHLDLVPQQDAEYLIVDEGPGLSGSSLASTAEALSNLGIPDSRIVFFPSWQPDPESLLSPIARDRFARHGSIVFRFDPKLAGLDSWRDVSAGKWRDLVCAATLPAVHPQHERVKFLSPDSRVLAKFAGFGSRAQAAFARSRILHDAGFVPAPIRLADGFLFSSFEPGRPVHRAPPALAGRIAQYLKRIERAMPSPHPVCWETLSEMIAVNLEETLGVGATRLLRMKSLVEDAPAHWLDGRMLPHEWIETASGFLKTDAVDHFDDHFFPGPQNIAWDVAAAMIEFSFDQSWLEQFDPDVRRRVPFFLAAYGAFRLAYCRMAEKNLAPQEAARFRRLAGRYEAVTRAALVQLAV